MSSRPDFPVTFQYDDVLSLDKTIKYDGFFNVTEYRFRHRLFEGGVSPVICREILERRDAVILLAYDAKRDSVVLIEQIRIGALRENKSPWLLEMIAGIVDTDESVEEVARREAMEEAGIEIGRCHFALNYLASPGGTNERLSVFVGEVDSSLATGVHGLAEEGEDIRVHVVLREQAYCWVNEGKIDNAGAIIALQWLQLNYVALQQAWTK